MALTTDSAIPLGFDQKVYNVIRQIPSGRVTSYGHISKLVRGHTRNARLVGQTLKFIPHDYQNPMMLDPNTSTSRDGDPTPSASTSNATSTQNIRRRRTVPNPFFVPWHRVINSAGVISPRGSVAAVERQANWLRNEGIEVRDGARGGGDGDGDGGRVGDTFDLAGVEGGRVSMRKYGWFPDSLELENEDGDEEPQDEDATLEENPQPERRKPGTRKRKRSTANPAATTARKSKRPKRRP